MKSVHLNALNIDAPVPDNYFFHDDGEVEDPSMHLDSLFRKYGKDPKRIQPTGMQPEGAYMIAEIYFPSPVGGQLPSEVHSHIFINKNQTPSDKMFSRGHEETHFLIDLEKIGLLQESLLEWGVKENSLEGLTFEAICNVGGFYSLRTNLPNKGYQLVHRTDDLEFLGWLKANTDWELK